MRGPPLGMNKSDSYESLNMNVALVQPVKGSITAAMQAALGGLDTEAK